MFSKNIMEFYYLSPYIEFEVNHGFSPAWNIHACKNVKFML